MVICAVVVPSTMPLTFMLLPDGDIAPPSSGVSVNVEAGALALRFRVFVPVVKVIDPSVLVSNAKAGSAPVAPMRTVPLFPTDKDVRLPAPLPICTAWLVVPDTLIVAVPPKETGDPVTVILLPLASVIELLASAEFGTLINPIDSVFAPVVSVTPCVPATVPKTGAAPVAPINTWPLVPAFVTPIGDVPLPY